MRCVLSGITPACAGNTDLYPRAFESEEELARTLYHEKDHIDQIREHGVNFVLDEAEYFNDLTFKAEDDWWETKKNELG